jgi:hypothetical protein
LIEDTSALPGVAAALVESSGAPRRDLTRELRREHGMVADGGQELEEVGSKSRQLPSRRYHARLGWRVRVTRLSE